MKFILVSGGVISGIGKGIIASSVGTILKSCGLVVTSIKIDPYLNIGEPLAAPEMGARDQRTPWLAHPIFLNHVAVLRCRNILSLRARCEANESVWGWEDVGKRRCAQARCVMTAFR